MRLTIAFFLFFNYVLFTGCKEESSSFKLNRIINNDSKHEVLIRAYQSPIGIVEEITIKPSEFSFESQTCDRETGDTFCDLIWGLQGDSVEVVFSNEKRQLFCSKRLPCYSSDRNIMIIDLFDKNNSGYLESELEGVRTFTYTITEEDYQNADPVGD